MFWFLVGHRGVGKSQFIERLKSANHSLSCNLLSLDRLIEADVGKTIPEIFAAEGESGFRDHEARVLTETYQRFKSQPTFLDVGAGYQGQFPPEAQVLWIQRPTNPKNFSFLNRPLLDRSLGLSANRFKQRESFYQSVADLSLEFMEGGFHPADFDRSIAAALISNSSLPLGGTPWVVTLLNDQHLEFHQSHKLLQNLRFELRDDLLTDDQIFSFLKQRPDSLVSLRRSGGSVADSLPEGTQWDWPLEWGPNSHAPILSLHQRKKSFQETLDGLPASDHSILKLAVPVLNFDELIQGHEWQQENPARRIFLPSSVDGRWSWYRLLTAAQMPLSFVREGRGSAPDQPTLQSVAMFRPDAPHFAAILGAPVIHSLTPSFHFDYFKSKDANVLSIMIEPDEFALALPFLKRLGLKWAAVTSPLKDKAAEFASAQIAAVNTLFLEESCTRAVSTDSYGFKKLVGDIGSSTVAVWGGGGTIEAMAAVLPNATFYSSRDGSVKRGSSLTSPDVVVWAVGRSQFERQGVFPPEHWSPSRVIDLNYTADSPGIGCAHNYGCQYQSGLAMFIEQAIQQQEFWNECELK